MSTPVFAWYSVVRGSTLEQGDILRGLPVLIPASVPEQHRRELVADARALDVVVMTQSCDLVSKAAPVHVMVCEIIELATAANQLGRDFHDFAESVRKGREVRFHLLNEGAGTLPIDFHVVALHRTHVVPYEYTSEFAAQSGDRLRIMPPYREHLSQSFARYYMRVGLPHDIRPFQKRAK